MATFRVALVWALVATLAVAEVVPISGLFQSNGSTCTSVTLNECFQCGSSYYSCSSNGYGGYNCDTSDENTCSLMQGSASMFDYCSSQVCSFAHLPNYQFEVTTTSGVAVFHSGESDVYGTVSLTSTDLTVVANTFEGIVVTSTAASDVLFMEPGIYSDNTFLTNKGFCPVDEWCTADADLTYRLALSSNSSHPVTTVTPQSNTLALLVDTLGLVTTSESLDMTWYEERMYIPDDQVDALEVNLWPTGIKWSKFQLKELYEDTTIIWEVTAGTDFSIYFSDECDDDDGVQNCHVDAIFDLSGIISNPFIHPFFSFSFLFNEVEAPAEVVWDEQPTFNLFD